MNQTILATALNSVSDTQIELLSVEHVRDRTPTLYVNNKDDDLGELNSTTIAKPKRAVPSLKPLTTKRDKRPRRTSSEQRCASLRKACKRKRTYETVNPSARNYKRHTKSDIKHKNHGATSATDEWYGREDGRSLPGSSRFLQSIYDVATTMKKLVKYVQNKEKKQP